MRTHLLALATLALAGCHAATGTYSPAPLPTTAEARIQHASIEGTLAGVGKPTKRQFFNGFALGTLLGPFGAIIGYVSTDADPPDVPIHPRPNYADTSAAYVLAFRRAYDAQVKSDRRGSALVGGLLGMVVSGVVVYSITKHD
jgi:hypothetical protein